jgi:acyl-CoA synthetase (NDP forming)
MNFEEHAAKPLLRAAGIDTPKGRLAASVDEAVAAAHERVAGVELFGRGLGRSEIEIAKHHLGALGDEHFGDGVAQASRTPRDNRSLSRQQ